MTEELLKAIILSSAVLYFISAILHFFKKNVPAYIVNALAFTLNAFLVGLNWVKNGYVPFISMYQVLTFVSLCFTISYLYMHFINKSGWMAPYFMLCSGIAMVGVNFMETPLTWLRAPALQSPWFIPHVLCYMFSYTLCAVSFIICIAAIIKSLRQKDPLKEDNGIHNVIRMAYPFMTAGLLFGAIWANEIWGHFWSWDSKENWALITWLLYAVYLHCYSISRNRTLKYTFIILGFIALIMTLFGVNLFSNTGQHTYT